VPDANGNPTIQDILQGTPNVPDSQIPAGYAQGGFGLPPTAANIAMYNQAQQGVDPTKELGNISAILQRYQQPAPNFLQRLATNLGSNPQEAPQSQGQGFAQGIQNAFVNAQMGAMKRRQAMNEATQNAALEINKTETDEQRAKQKMAQQSLLETARQREERMNILQGQAALAGNNKVLAFTPEGTPIFSTNGTQAVLTPQAAIAENQRQQGIAQRDRGLDYRGQQIDLSKLNYGLAKIRLQMSPNGPNSDQDSDQIVEGIRRGDLPPTMLGTRMTSYNYKIWSKLAGAGVPVRDMQTAYNATQKYYGTLNGRQQIQTRQSANTVNTNLDQIEALTNKLQSEMPRSDIQALDELSLNAGSKWNSYGPQVQSDIQQLVTLMSDTRPELANVYQAGGTPTDKALALSGKSLDDNLPPNRMLAAIRASRFGIGSRISAIAGTEPAMPGMNPLMPKLGGPNTNVPIPGSTVRVTNGKKSWDIPNDPATLAKAHARGYDPAGNK
jgi:hypothetical protein